MALNDVMVKLTYTQVGSTHLLVHMHCTKFIDNWMLLDLEELSRESGKSIDEVLERLCRKRVD